MRAGLAILAAVICGFVMPAQAQSPLPALYEVSGISTGDVLNVRTGPSTGYPVISTLPNGELVEVTARDVSGWARILQGEGDGWVSLRYLTAVGGAESTAPDPLYCGGTEPFWSLTLSDGQMEFSAMDQPTVPIAPLWRHGAAGSASGSFALGDETHVAVFNRRDCSDGMSDRTYGWELDFLLTGAEGTYLQGCCKMLR